MSAPEPRRSRGAVNVPPSDGYHFGDDHPWGDEEQKSLIGMLKRVRKTFEEEQRSDKDETPDE